MVTKKYEHLEENEFATLLAEDVQFQGIMDAQDSILVKGKCEDSAIKGTLLVVAREGEVQANVTMEYLVISGLVSGKVFVSENLHVLKDGDVKGTVTTNSLVVDHGAVINATCHMEKPKEQTQVSAPEKKAQESKKEETK